MNTNLFNMSAKHVAMRQSQHPRASIAKGFSMVELMVVLVLITLLFAVALPNYQQYFLRANRGEARLMLIRASHMQERYFLLHGEYASDAQQLYSISQDVRAQLDGAHYTLDVESDTKCAQTIAQGCYRLSARARATQRKDTMCQLWKMNHSGVVQVFDHRGRPREECL